MMKYLLYNLLFLLIISCQSGGSRADKQARSSADWPIFRGDAGLSGYSPHQIPADPELLWEFKSNKRTVSSPVIYNKTAYWCDRFGRLYGVGSDGTRQFDFQLNSSVEATPYISDSILYIGSIDGNMNAISLTTADLLWQYETLGQISASPNQYIINEDKILVFGSYDNNMYCLNSANGNELNAFESGYYLNGAAALSDHYIIYGGCDSWLRIIDCQTGIQTDSVLLEAYIPNSPAITGNELYIGDYMGNIYHLSLDNGKIKSQKKLNEATDDTNTFISVPAVSDELICFLSDDNRLYALSRKTDQPRWSYKLKGNPGESSPVITDDKIIICTKSGIVSLLDASSGELLWEYDTGEPIVASPAVIADQFYILTTRGTLLCFGQSNAIST